MEKVLFCYFYFSKNDLFLVFLFNKSYIVEELFGPCFHQFYSYFGLDKGEENTVRVDFWVK